MINFYEEKLRERWLKIRKFNTISYDEWRKSISDEMSKKFNSNVKYFNDKELYELLERD
ncbi:hypothetical protein [Clostridium perfringens]|uniref:hypothetical protein n=1 Tax=Clostridium perfringens TaxID=1502 RepID=UPI0039E99480